MKNILFALFLFTSFIAGANPAPEVHRRLVNFEWEEIENAKAYELMIITENNIAGEANEYRFIVDTPVWNGKLAPGYYSMKLRSLDYRKVPGAWSEASQFTVALDNVVMVTPKVNELKISSSAQEEKVEFVWNHVAGADYYTFEIMSDDQKFQEIKAVKENVLTLSLPVAKSYTWKVKAENNQKIQSEATSVSSFNLKGSELKAPRIASPANEFVREIAWEKVENAEGYDVVIVRFDPASKKWQKIESLKNHQDTKIPFNASYKGGQYQVFVTPVGKLRGQPKPQKVSFKAVEGDRSPASEYRTLIRSSIDRTNGWYALASYMITNMSYNGQNPEVNSQISYEAVGGTIRVGGGHLSKKSNWGFNAIYDYSGFNFEGDFYTFSGVEVNGIYRRTLGEKGELRLNAGPYYRELPETTFALNSGRTQENKISVLGANIGAEYWYSFTPKIGMQLNSIFYLPLVGMDTPNGNDINFRLSASLGFMGSYRFNKNTTVLGGYTLKKEAIAYNARTGPSSFANQGNENISEINGHYLNVHLEWSF